MQLSEIPAKLVLAFAAAGGKNAIPVAANPTPGGASYSDGFPPLTRTPISGGGIPPSGLDMNGVLFEETAVTRWLNASGTFPFDQDFADDAEIGGYPAGAMLLQSDGSGIWLNQADDQVLNPNDAGAAAAGWVPGVRYGVTAVTMTNANVTLTPLQYARPIIVISGVLSTNVQLIFPAIAAQWVVINNTTGAFTINCKTASGSGILASANRLLYCDGTNIKQAATDVVATSLDACAVAGGTADAITAAFPNILPASYLNGMPFYVRAGAANTITNPTITFNSGTLTPTEIVKGANFALAIGDIAGAGHWLMLQHDTLLDKVVLLNPALGIVTSTPSSVVGISNNFSLSTTGLDANITASVDEVVVESASGQFITVRNLSLVKTTAVWAAGTAAGALDTGSITQDWYYLFVIYNPSTQDSDFLISLSATAPTMPSGFTYKGLVGAIKTDDSFGGYYPLSILQKGNEVQYKIASGSNVAQLPTIAAGALGNINTPTWSAQSVSFYVPSIASHIDVLLNSPTSGSGCIAAPNSLYGGRADLTNPPLFLADNSPETVKGRMMLESSNVYFAGNSGNSRLQCVGYKLR